MRMDSVDPGIFEAWLVSTQDGVVAVDAEGRVVLHNPAASRVTGLAPSSAQRRPWRDVLRLDPPISDLLWTAQVSRCSTSALASVLCAQGNLRTAEILAQPWTDVAGRTGILVIIRDLTVLCRTRTGPGGRAGYGSLVGADPAMTALFDLIEAVAPSDAPVVIEGEPGVGKELVAQAIHARSRRSERPLVVVDCGAVQPARLEPELFGERRPGPHGTASIGRAELAHSGTLFLKRVDAASLTAQSRILRLLETGSIERDGEGTARRVDVRLIAGTEQPLEPEVRSGRFRDELLRRLQVVRLRVPPLRERRSDIPLLGEHFLARYRAPRTTLSAAAAAVLQACDWAGNVRQLEAVMRGVAERVGPEGETLIQPSQLPELLLPTGAARPVTVVAYPTEDRRTVLLRALSSHGGNRTAAARAHGIGRATFYRWWRDAGLGGEERELR
jgi:two-component system response regulator HydG